MKGLCSKCQIVFISFQVVKDCMLLCGFDHTCDTGKIGLRLII